MATAREIKRRIRSIKNIAKVTGALEAVAASKVRRAQNQAMASREYTAAAVDILRELTRFRTEGITHPLLDERPSAENVLVILITSDRGLAGPYNANMIRRALRFERAHFANVSYIAVGKKGRDVLLRRGATIVAEFTDIPDRPAIPDITAINRAAVDEFLGGGVDEVYVAYTDFINTLHQEPVVRRLLPLLPEERHTDQKPESDRHAVEPPGPHPVFEFEPNIDAILDEILPRFNEVLLFQDLLEALASEHSARMVAMRSATENANALVDDLTLTYNKARQLAITSEMLDIVGGAEALG
jgi:F-type H+-transporting ATPase subunit gamma